MEVDEPSLTLHESDNLMKESTGQTNTDEGNDANTEMGDAAVPNTSYLRVDGTDTEQKIELPPGFRGYSCYLII